MTPLKLCVRHGGTKEKPVGRGVLSSHTHRKKPFEECPWTGLPVEAKRKEVKDNAKT